jgi:hypothetical protein
MGTIVLIRIIRFNYVQFRPSNRTQNLGRVFLTESIYLIEYNIRHYHVLIVPRTGQNFENKLLKNNFAKKQHFQPRNVRQYWHCIACGV